MPRVRQCFLARSPDRAAVAAVPKLDPRCLVDVRVGILLACWFRVEEFRYVLLRLGLLFHLWLEPDLIGRSFHPWEQDQLL
jgi:hypothetical protein